MGMDQAWTCRMGSWGEEICDWYCRKRHETPPGNPGHGLILVLLWTRSLPATPVGAPSPAQTHLGCSAREFAGARTK